MMAMFECSTYRVVHDFHLVNKMPGWPSSYNHESPSYEGQHEQWLVAAAMAAVAASLVSAAAATAAAAARAMVTKVAGTGPSV